MPWDILVGAATLLFILYLWLTWNYGYWSSHSVPHIQPTIFFGNLKDMILMKKPTGNIYDEFYWKYPDQPAVGIYKLRQPQLILRNAELFKTVLSVDFNSFHDNDFAFDSESDPIVSNSPFFTRGDKWKASRAIHTPGVTGNKLRAMVPIMVNVCKDMIDFVSKNLEKPLEAKYFCGQYTTDIVASCVYGLSSNSFKDPNATFRQMAYKVFKPGFWTNLTFLCSFLAPSLIPLFRLRVLPDEVREFFKGIIKDTLIYRKTNGVTRNDFLQHLINENEKHEKPIYTDDQIVAYTMTFFFDCYETTSILISYVLYQLGKHKEVQEKLREEIKMAVSDLDKIDFETINSLQYLDAAISETLRMFPPATVLSKLCTQDTTLRCDGMEYPIKKGQTIALPLFSIHRDPKYFPDPKKYDPERFYQKDNNVEGYFPFGFGPRACIGTRFALTQTKMAIISLLSNFKISLKDDSPQDFEFDPLVSILLVVKDGLWIKFESLKGN